MKRERVETETESEGRRRQRERERDGWMDVFLYNQCIDHNNIVGER